MSSFDTGAIARNALCAQLTAVVARVLDLSPASRCADFGGGHGVFVRMMRDRGMDFRLCDKYAQNLFARGFDADPQERVDLMTSFEVFEHFADPGIDLEQLFLPRHDFLLAGTVLHREHREGWWYYSPQTGQHVAFYSRATMQHIATRFGYRAIPGPAYTLFIRRDVELSKWRLRTLARLIEDTRPNRNSKWVVALAAVLPKYPARTASDLETLTRERKAA